jgi:hypothetical protein
VRSTDNLGKLQLKLKNVKRLAKSWKSLKGWRMTPFNLKARLEGGQRFRKNCCTLLTKRTTTSTKDLERIGSYKEITMLISSTESQMAVKGRELFSP